MDQRTVELLETLPPLIACIVWDVLNNNISLQTIELADMVDEAEWQQYEIVRCVAAGNPELPPTEEAQVLVEIMFEDLALPVA
jgi:hypothetical protein